LKNLIFISSFFQKFHLRSHKIFDFFIENRQKVILNGKMVFAKLKNFFAKLIFFPPNFFFAQNEAQKDFFFPKYQKKFWREKN
jgi:hypothetical protein